MRVHDDQHTERARARAEYARSVFAPTPVASAFEVTFGVRFYDYVCRGGSPDIQAFTKHELERRLRFCDGTAAVATTVVAFALLSTTPPPPEGAAELSGPAGFLAAWLAAGLWLLAPAMLARRHVRRSFQSAGHADGLRPGRLRGALAVSGAGSP